MVSTPDFASPLQMGNFPAVLSDILIPMRTPPPEVEGITAGQPSPSSTRRKMTDPLAAQSRDQDDAKPGGEPQSQGDAGFRDVKRVDTGQGGTNLWGSGTSFRTAKTKVNGDTFAGRIGTRPRGGISFKEEPPE